jgi:hypothetical protein
LRVIADNPVFVPKNVDYNGGSSSGETKPKKNADDTAGTPSPFGN